MTRNPTRSLSPEGPRTNTRVHRLVLLATVTLLASTGAGVRAGHAVVVELFTSQGCSTCPPADRLLSKLGEERGLAVVPLAFHVDIWNHIGWNDPFSSKDWTQRQVAYARRFGLEQLSTPQAVVDGGAQLVGSDEGGLRAAIASAAMKPAGAVALRVEADASKIRADAEVTLPESLRDRKLDLIFALYETGLVTAVGRGENEGHTLHDDYVVRRLVRAARLSPGGSGPTRHGSSFSIEKGWDRTRLGVAAFLQDSASLEIRGADVRALAAGNAGSPKP